MRLLTTMLIPLARPPVRTGQWSDGPLPLALPNGGVTDARTRSTYFDDRAAGVIYGHRTRCERSHLQVDQLAAGPLQLLALEWLALPELNTTAGVLIAHLSAELPQITTLTEQWSALVRWKLDSPPDRPLLLAISDALGAPIVPVASHQEPYRIAFLDQMPTTDHPFPASRLEPVTQWLLWLAAAVPPGSFSPGTRQQQQFEDATLSFSSDWSAMVLRDGAAFIGHADTNPDFLAHSAPLYVRSIYTDALLIAFVQRLALTDLSDRLARLDDPARNPRGVERLDAEFSRFRNRLWWQHLTQHGPGNELLLAYQRQHRLPELMEQTRSELDDYSRQASLRAARILNVVVAVFALIGAIGVLAELSQLLGSSDQRPSAATLWLAGALLLVVLALVITYPLGHLSRWLPRRRRPYRPPTRRHRPTSRTRRRRSDL